MKVASQEFRIDSGLWEFVAKLRKSWMQPPCPSSACLQSVICFNGLQAKPPGRCIPVGLGFSLTPAMKPSKLRRFLGGTSYRKTRAGAWAVADRSKVHPHAPCGNRIVYQIKFVKQTLSNRISGSSMAKRRGNPNWGKPEPIGPITPTVTEFEQVVREYKLSPDQYLRSTRLREWARRNKNSKYIPEPLLEAWGFEIESTL
jgi:hypothetical protein